MEFIIIGTAAFFASILTFFSGFGLSTILTPLFVLFFPVDVAIGLTAVVHFLNNLFKVGLTGKSVNWGVTLKFGIPAIVGAFFGAKLLTNLNNESVLYSYNLFGMVAEIQGIKLIISIIMIAFAVLELIPKFNAIQFKENKLPIGGVISGFFGGLSGHQGALRSLFLLRCGLTKQSFIASGIAIATFIDVTRISVYVSDMGLRDSLDEWPILTVALSAAFIGAVLGKKLLKKVTLQFVQIMVSTLIIVLAILLGIGII